MSTPGASRDEKEVPRKKDPMSPRVLVAGLGNVLMGDDGIGPHCIEYLQTRYEFSSAVTMADLNAPGLDLAMLLSSADVVVAIGAIRGVEPGSVHVFDRSAVESPRHPIRLDKQMLGLRDSIALVELVRRAPLNIAFIGLGGATFAHAVRLSGVAREGMNALTERVLAVLTCLDLRWRPRAIRHAPSLGCPQSDAARTESVTG
jgi:hydrogenase maturation protease